MHRSASRWIWGLLVVAIVIAGFYGLRHERRVPAPISPSGSPVSQHLATKESPQAAPASALPPAPATQPQAEPTAIPKSTAGSGPHDLSPKAAAKSPAVPDFVDLVQAVKPAVVSVRVKADVAPEVTSSEDGANPFEGTPFAPFFKFGSPGQNRNAPHQYMQALGSGFLVSADGEIVTNNHVVANAVQVQIVKDDGTVLDAKVLGTDPKTDLALLKVEGTAFPFVTLADDLPRVGEWVIALGNPFGLGGTVTAGIVSAQGRNIGGPYDDFLQIDAAVNRGNSGGPTFNMSGRVVGVNTAIYSPSGGSVGIAFDIPATTVRSVLAQLKERGFVERGWIGVQAQPVTKEIADSLGLKEAEGALIAATQPDSPAAKSGLKAGDVVTTLNGRKVKDPRDLAREVAGMAPNSTAQVEYIRDGKQETAQLAIAELKRAPSPQRPTSQSSASPAPPSRLGITLAPASRVMGIGEQGVGVIRVDPAGTGAEAGLRPGDVILQMGGKEVSDPSEVTRTLEAASKQNKQHVLALVRRNDREIFFALPTG
jgi:serine protease Do